MRQERTTAARRGFAATNGVAQPQDPTPALKRAIELLRSEQLEAAGVALEAILTRWPQQADALHYLGVLRHTQGRSEEGARADPPSAQQVPH